MVSITGCAGSNKSKPAIMLEGSIFNPVFYPPLTRYYSLGIQGAVFGLFDRDTKGPEKGLLNENNLLLAADADIYNIDELKEKLGVEKQRNISSAEVILLSYKRWNRNCVNYLHGDFAFTIWDAEKRELFCARDPMGVRPFYYCCFPGIFIFSSELRPLKELYPDTLRLNKPFLLDTLVTHVSQKELTPFENIFRLPPAHYLCFYEGNTTIVKYWEPDINKEIRLKSPVDYYEMLSEKLIRAVTERIPSDSVVGAELSGGLDSSLITALAFDASVKRNIPFYALSNTLPANSHEKFSDERKYIMKVIDSTKIPWIEVSYNDRSLINLIKHTVRLQGSYLQQRFGMFNDMLYKKASENGVKYLFSGFGGDELLSARISTPWNDVIAGGDWRTLFSLLRFEKNKVKAIFKALKHAVKYYGWDLLTPRYTYGVFEKPLLKKRFSSLALNSEFSEKNGLWNIYREKYRRENCKYTSQKQFQRLNHPHLPQRMEYCYTSAAFHNVRYYYPLLDARLIQSYFSVPAHIRYGEGGNRWLFRNIMKGFVSEELCKRDDKSGITIPYIQPKLVEEKDLLFSFISECASKGKLAEIFDFSKMSGWHERLIAGTKEERNYLMPGAFYSYLMIMVYFDEQESITGF
jgi:asparagine synthase (glutamine-hydrolysing)